MMGNDFITPKSSLLPQSSGNCDLPCEHTKDLWSRITYTKEYQLKED